MTLAERTQKGSACRKPFLEIPQFSLLLPTKFLGISENGPYSDLLIPDLFLSPAAEFAEDVYPMSNVIINKPLAEKENLWGIRGSNEALEEEELWADSEQPCDLEQGLKLRETNVFLPYNEELAQRFLRFLSFSIFLISKGSFAANDTKTPCSKYLCLWQS